MAEYDWVAYGDVLRDASGKPTGAIPGTAQLKRVTASNYHNQTPTADSGSYSASIYNQTTAPNLRSAVAWSEVRSNTSEASAVSRAEFYYDDANGKGNLTAQRSWDSTKGALARPLSPGTYIAVSHQYDTFGNRIFSTDARGVRTQFVFGSINGFTDLYPTETRVAVDYPALKRTSTLVYDFWTGLVTTSTDVDNNVSTIVTFDVFGRPTLVRAAADKPEETRTATEYSDVNRRVIVRSDLNAVGDGKIVSIQHYDQLGRVRLSRQLEDSAQDATEESHGIKVQTRYLFSGSNSYTLTSNPYRAATSSAAGSEGTMGWSRIKMDNGGRLVEAQTFGSAGLPAPWGTNSTSTGTVTTVYDAESVTVTDQDQPTGKKRKSVTDALGRLKEVYEDPLGVNYQTSYVYDVLDNLASVTQGSQQRFFMYSSLKRLIRARNLEQEINVSLNLTDPLTGNGQWSLAYQYDNNGGLTQKTDARSIVTTYVYDELNRNTTVNYSDTPSINPDITRIYDIATYGKGRLRESYFGGTETVGAKVEHTRIQSYDALGRAKDQRQRFKSNGVWSSSEYQVQRSYNRASGVTAQIYPSGRTVNYSYDDAGRLISFTGNLGDNTTRTYSTGIVYSALGGMAKEQFGTDTPLYNKSFYNSRGQLSEIRVGTTYTGPTDGGWQRGAIINHYSSQCWGACNGSDNNGNLKQQDHWIQDGNGNVQGLFVQSYTYDSLNRLWRVNEGGNWQQEYVYDRWGNRTIHQTNTWGTGIPKPNFGVSTTTNRLTAPMGYAMTYDYAGNLTNDNYTGAGAREYDAEDRMTRAWGGASQWQDYSYNADGQRTRRKVDGLETWHVYGLDGELLAEYPYNGAVTSPQKEYGYRNGQLLITAEPRTNFALAANSAVASASSTYTPGSFAPGGAINGDRKGLNWGNNGGWNDAAPGNTFSDWLEVDFNGSKTINEINVFTGQDTPFSPLEPTEAMTFSLYGLTGLYVQYWTGSAWATVTGGNITGNNKVWRKITFATITTSKIRVLTNASVDGYSRITEVEAWGPAINWLVADQLGTPRMIFDTSGSLATTKRHDYLPFGEELFAGTGGRTTILGYIADTTRQKFTSYERDGETNLDFAQARYYANAQGRFTSGDPLLASAAAGDPQSWNRYSYVGNSPLVAVDPSGMMTNHNFYVDNSDFMVDISAPAYYGGIGGSGSSASAAEAGMAAGLVGGVHEIGHLESGEPQDTSDQEPRRPPLGQDLRNDPRLLFKPGKVYVCKRPTQFNGVFSVVNNVAYHYWLRTDEKEAGLGADGGGVPGQASDSPGLTQTSINDHTGQWKLPDASCELDPDANPKIVNQQLEIGKPMGRFGPNNCLTFVQGVLFNSYSKKKQMECLAH